MVDKQVILEYLILVTILQVWKRKAEQYLADSGVPYTIIRLTCFYACVFSYAAWDKRFLS